MTTTRIPIYDLLIFLDEKGETFERKNNILDFVVNYTLFHFQCASYLAASSGDIKSTKDLL